MALHNHYSFANNYSNNNYCYWNNFFINYYRNWGDNSHVRKQYNHRRSTRMKKIKSYTVKKVHSNLSCSFTDLIMNPKS